MLPGLNLLEPFRSRAASGENTGAHDLREILRQASRFRRITSSQVRSWTDPDGCENDLMTWRVSAPLLVKPFRERSAARAPSRKAMETSSRCMRVVLAKSQRVS